MADKPKKFELNPLIVRYSGLFDFDGLYAAITDWTKNYGYIWHEKKYKHKVPSPRGAEQEFGWQIEKEVNDLVSYKIMIEAHAWDILEVVVDTGGMKKSLTKARIEIYIKPTVILDWQGKFKGGSPWQKKFKQKLWNMYFTVMQRELEVKYTDQLTYRLYGFQSMLKKYFDMQSKYHAYKNYLGEQ